MNSHAGKLPHNQENDDFILSRSLFFSDYSWLCDNLLLHGVYSTAIRGGGGREERSNSHSLLKLPCSIGLWEVKRQRGDYSSTYVPAEPQALHLAGYGRLCVLLLLVVFAWSFIITRQRLCSPAKPTADGGGQLRPGCRGSFVASSPRCSERPFGDAHAAQRETGRSARATGYSCFAASLQRVQVLDATVPGLGPVVCSPRLFII